MNVSSVKRVKTVRQQGYIFPMILMATLSVGLFLVTFTQMQGAAKARFAHLNEYQRAFNIAASAMVEALADLNAVQWDNRAFKGSPVAYTRDLFDGRYNLLIEDQDADKHLFNTKIRVNYADKNYLFYWRLRYVPDLIDFTTFTIPVYFGQIPNVTGTMADFDSADAIVDSELERRKNFRERALEIATELDQSESLVEALRKIGINVADIQDGDVIRIPFSPLAMDGGEVLAPTLTSALNDGEIPDSGFIPFDPPVEGLIDINSLWLRIRSSPWGEIVGRLYPQTTTTLIGEQEDWYVLIFKGKRCFIHQNHVSIPGRPASKIDPVPPY